MHVTLTAVRRAVFTVTVLAAPAQAQQAAGEHRNAFVAGSLSYLFPGVGSLYAGNSKHALVHSAVAVGAAVGVLAALGDQRCDPSCSTRTKVVGGAGILTIGVNSVWSIVTAVKDARAFNRIANPGDTVKRAPVPYGIRAHLAVGAGKSPYLSDAMGGSTFETRVGIGINALPDWTLTWANGTVMNTKPTNHFEPSCAAGRGCRPDVYVSTAGMELQRRWWRGHSVHPLATVGVGRLKTSYGYSKNLISFTSMTLDSIQTRRFVSAGVGLDADVFRWVHGAVIAGYRATSGHTIPAGTSSNSGPTLLWLVELGRP